MAYRREGDDLIIDGWDKGISPSPYQGIANIQNVNTYYYPSVAYVNYRRQAATITTSGGSFFAGIHSTNVSNNIGWVFTGSGSMQNPIDKAVSPQGLIYILDSNGNIFKQSAVNSSTFAILENTGGRLGNGAGGIAWWNNYLFVFGDGFIEVCGNGTGDAGITSANWNLGAIGAVINSQTFTVGGSPQAEILVNTTVYPPYFIGEPVQFTTTGTLPAPLVAGTTYYIVYVGSNTLFVATSYPDATLCTGTIAQSATSATLVAPFAGVTGTYSVVFSQGDYRAVTFTNSSTAITWTGGLSATATATINIVVTTTTSGTGTQSIVTEVSQLPLGNVTNLTFNTGVLQGATAGNLTSYTRPNGTTAYIWLEATGIYNVVDSYGNNLLATFTNGSVLVTFITPLIIGLGAGGLAVNLLNPTATTYRAYVSKSDGNLYFCNGNSVGRIYYNPATGVNFNPTDASSYLVKYQAVAPTIETDSIVDMTDLSGQLFFTGQKDIYVWDYVAVQPNATRPVGENISRITNLLNNVYILAGQKGNIYFSNGYSVQKLTKLIDYISGTFDPVWSWGDLMVHRSRLYFQALAQNTTGTNLLAGIFSLQVSPSILGETSSGLIMEAQNSYGLIPASGAVATGVLVDNEPSSNGQDSYYSAWSNGASFGGIDFNDTTLWQNFEPSIETDIIPIGSFFSKNTSGQLEFKLDRPMATGDQIKLYYRPSLSDSYVQIGQTFTNLQLSDAAPSNIFQNQWAQFKITFKCAASGSSFIPFRELRLHTK